MPLVAHHLLRPRARTLILRSVRSRRRAFAARLAHRLSEFFAAQADRVLLRQLHGTKALHPTVGELLPPEEDRLLSLAIAPYLDASVTSFAELASLMLGVRTTDPAGAAVQRVLTHAGQRITRINDATRRAVQGELQMANERGYNLYQTAHGFAEEGYRGLDSVVRQLYRNRSEAIARTEVGQASQEAAQAQWSELGVGYQEIIEDPDTDEECSTRNGDIVPIDEAVDLNHPNCQVVSLPVVSL